jgi:hypothetical protein
LKRLPRQRVKPSNDLLSSSEVISMKTLRNSLAILAVLAFAAAPTLLRAQDGPPPNGAYAPPAPSDDSGAPPPPEDTGGPAPDGSGGDSGASFQQFYDQLGSQGTWVQTDNYGYAFQPNVSDPNWAPYTDGHWVYTNVGWTWASDEPWGWATYHYGRWANIDGTGWVWIPGYQWAPAWVSWRYGGGYAGWAPLPPASFIGVDFADPGVDIGIGFHFGGDCDVNFGIGAYCYNFINVGYIGDPYYRGRYIDRRRNFEIINNTRNITNINYNRNERGAFRGVNVGGPSLAEVNAHSHTRMQEVRLAESGRAGRSTLNGNTLNVYAPHINPASRQTARPQRVGATLSNVQLNRGESVTRPMAVNSHLRPAAPSAEQIQAARQAEASAPADSHIATSRTVPRTTLNRPLSSMATPNRSGQTRAETNQQEAEKERDNRVQRVDAAKAANQQDAEKEKDNRVREVDAAKAANQQDAEKEKNNRVRDAEADKAANQQDAQKERTDRVDAAQERAARVHQEEATHQQEVRNADQNREEHDAALQRERAGSEQRTEQRTDRTPAPQQRTPVQQHAPVPQQHAAPAPQQRAAPAQGNNNGDKKNN